MTETANHYPDLARPEKFTQEQISWVPWLEPIAENELTERQIAGLSGRGTSFAYFRLLASDPEVLKARTATDLDIFYNTDGGLPRADRELAAAAASRLNGCVFCASVHSRAAAHHSKRPDDVQRLLDEGVGVRIDDRWDAIIDASSELTRTPVAFGAAQIAQLTDAGLSPAEILDVVYGAAFFNWANRLMLTIGEPEVVAA